MAVVGVGLGTLIHGFVDIVRLSMSLEELPYTCEDGSKVETPCMPEGGVVLEGAPYILEDVIPGKVSA